jgi:HAMP domain-containing protein/predicted Ser/Thr protein kinase
VTAQTLERPLADTGPVQQRKAAAVERPKFPLVLKLFLMTALLIVTVVGLAIGITIQRANTIARTTVNNSISGAARLFREFEDQRLKKLTLDAQLVSNQSTTVAYIQKALTPGAEPSAAPTTTAPPTASPLATTAVAPVVPDLVSILDLLTQLKDSFGSNLLILLDDQGRLIARSDMPATTAVKPEDFYEQSPLVKRIVDDASLKATVGTIVTNNQLYHAAVVPIVSGANSVRVGYLINASAIDGTFADRIAESTNAGVMFVPSPKLASILARSSNAPSVGMQQMRGLDQIFKTGKPVPPSNVHIEQSEYVMTGLPLQADKQTVGAAVFLRSLDRELAPFKQIENTLLAGGGAALLLAFLFSWLIAKRVTRPIEELAGVAQAVTAGDYTVHPKIEQRGDEVGILGRSFEKMITSLRDKAELEELYEQMAAKSEEREAAGPARVNEPPMLEEGTLLVTDLRGVSVGESDAASVIALVTRAMRTQELEVSRQDGNVREIVGHRLVSVFHGERGVIHAIRAARAINEELASQTASGSTLSIGVGIATGQFVSGSIALEQESGLAILGNAPLLALLFAWHAPSGYAYISYETAQTAGGEVMSTSQREEVKLRWLQQPLPVASLPLASMSTSMMRAIGANTTTSSMATMRIDGTSPGVTAPAAAAAQELAPGALFAGRYRIEQILGRGGMGVVYKAVDAQLDETVAIKTLPGDVMQRSPEDLERFKREIRLARKITHRNVLRTYDYGEAEGVYFISMEFVRGYTLSELSEEVENRQMAPRVAVGVSRQICRGLQVAHEQGIIHRDIKPQNVLIDHKGEVKLMDFGIARMAEAPEAMTQAGLIVGTPHYMSPEQVQGKQLDPRSDVYSMGVLIYEMLVGRRPFESSSLTGVLTAHITEKPKPPIELRPEIGRDINAIVMKCLEKDPKSRYANAGELLHDLDSLKMPQAAAA